MFKSSDTGDSFQKKKNLCFLPENFTTSTTACFVCLPLCGIQVPVCAAVEIVLFTTQIRTYQNKGVNINLATQITFGAAERENYSTNQISSAVGYSVWWWYERMEEDLEDYEKRGGCWCGGRGWGVLVNADEMDLKWQHT